MSTSRIALISSLLTAAAASGYFAARLTGAPQPSGMGMGEQSDGGDSGPGEGTQDREILYWKAPMDPSYQRDEPGKSPMGMDLIPVYEGEEPSGDPEEVTLSAAEVNTIGVRSAVARVEEI